MKRALLALPLVFAACAAEQAPPPKEQPKVEQQRIAAVGYFDLATLAITPPAIPARVNKEVLTGVVVAARPYVLDCLVDPANRGADKQTTVVVDATLVDAGVDYKITGQNMTPAGTACVEGVLKKWTAALPGLNAKAASAPAAAHAEFQHVVGMGASPSVVLGVSEASDIAAGVRLALPGWGDCLTDWSNAPPRLLKAALKVVRPEATDAGPAPAQVSPDATFEPAGDPMADKIAACLKGKIGALKVKTPVAASVTVPFTFRFIHSGLGETLPTGVPEDQFAQLEIVRGRRSAEAAIAVGDRGVAAYVYDAAVTAFKSKAKPLPTVKELKDKCAALLAGDDRVVEAMKKQLAIEDTTHTFAAAQKAKDASWSDAEAAAAQKVAQAQKDVAMWQDLRKQNEAACPKER